MYFNDVVTSVTSNKIQILQKLKSNMAGESPDVFRESGSNAAFSGVLINQKKHVENRFVELGKMVKTSMSSGFERF